ncbi:MAG: hypothetical protein ACLPVI_07065, partial [Dehalococcoidales bacterium]
MADKKQKTEKSVAVRQPGTKRQNIPGPSGDIFGQPFLPSLWGGFYNDQAFWAPAINVVEKEDKFIAKV